MSLKQTAKHLALSTLAALERRQFEPLASIDQFLLIQHESALGTAIHTTPLIPALRAAVPNARIVVAGSGFVTEVFRDNPGVDHVLTMPNPLRSVSTAAKWLRQQLPSHLPGPFTTLFPQGNERTSIALATWKGNCRNRVGFTLAPELFRTTLVFDPARSQIENNLRLIEALGHTPAQHFEPQIFFKDADREYANSLLSAERNRSRPLAVFVTQTSVTQRKSWPAERFIASAKWLGERYGAQIVFVGTQPEREAIDAIRSRVNTTTWNVAGQTNLQQLAAVLSLCDVGLTLDTGTLHVGRAVALPMAVIAPAWSPPVEWLPLDNPRYIILKNLDLPVAPLGYVIDEVSVDEAIASLDKLLQRFPPRLF